MRGSEFEDDRDDVEMNLASGNKEQKTEADEENKEEIDEEEEALKKAEPVKL